MSASSMFSRTAGILAYKDSAINVLAVLLFGMILINGLLAYSLVASKDRFTIDIPPAISGGISLQPGTYLPHTIHSYGLQTFISLWTWNTTGDVEYKDLLMEYSCRFSSDYFAVLQRQYRERLNGGELTNRSRRTYPTQGHGFTVDNAKQSVQPLSNTEWLVTYNLDVEEHVVQTRIKFLRMILPIKMIAGAPTDCNPWGLYIDGLGGEVVLEDLGDQ